MISIAGNNKLITTVENFITADRIPHAILIEGEYGTGKHTLAKFLSKAIVCEDQNKPCDNCKNCHLADISSHPDITVVTLESDKKTITVAQIRDLRENAAIKPHQAQKRIFIIDYADTMNANAQNALLKVLEEPPKTVMFILIAENKASLLDTIISRCTLLSLTVPQFPDSYEYIKKSTNFGESEITEALKDENNNIGRALNVLNGVSSSATEKAAEDFLKFALDCDRYSMLKLSADYCKSRMEAADFIKDLKFLISKRIKTNCNSVFTKPLMGIYDDIAEFEASLTTNINLNLLFSNLTSKMTEHIRRNK